MNKLELLHLNDERFKKVSKKLKFKLEEKTDSTFKISEIHEFLAESLGFRNFNDLSNILKNNKTDLGLIDNQIEPINNNKIFHNINHHNAFKMIELFIKKDNNLNYDRSCSLLSDYIEYLFWKNGSDKTELDTREIKNNLDLEKLTHSSRNENAPDHIRENIKFYLETLPGFHSPTLKQSATTIDFHRHITISIIQALNILQKVEENNFNIYNHQWIMENNINLPYIKYHNNIEFHELCNESWLKMPQYINFIRDYSFNKEITHITLLDFISYTSRIINPMKKIPLMELLSVIINNYDQAIKTSKTFDFLIKK